MKPVTLLTAAALCLAPAPLLAAERTTPEKPGGSCTVASVSCADYDASIAAQARAACAKYKLTWSEKPCPTANVAGTCVKREGAGRSYSHTYPPGTVETARKACANTPGGTFVR